MRGPRVRAALETALRDAVASGRLAPGARVPSSRALAADLGIARNTVADAYGQLVAEGWLTARQGSGTRVSDRAAPPAAQPAPARAAAAGRRYDLRPGSPDLSSFPRAGWLSAARRALASAPYDSLGYSDPRGRPELRAALAGYLARARGVRVSEEEIVICSGFTQGLWLICQVLRGRGARALALEQFVMPNTRESVIAGGLDVQTVPVDVDGARVEELRGADGALLTAAHQFPLGVALAPHRRAQAVQWAHETGALIVEDDYDGEFRYDRHPVGALQALAPERVIYAGTASKSLAPGLRLAWLAIPAHAVGEVLRAKMLVDRQTSAIEQLTLAEFIRSGAYDRHIRRSRLMYRRRRDRLVAELGRRVPQVRVSGIAAGLHALVELPDGVSEAEVVARAAERGLALEGLGAYGEGRQALVVGYAAPPEHAFTATLARLVAVLADATASATR